MSPPGDPQGQEQAKWPNVQTWKIVAKEPINVLDSEFVFKRRNFAWFLVLVFVNFLKGGHDFFYLCKIRDKINYVYVFMADFFFGFFNGGGHLFHVSLNGGRQQIRYYF